MRDATNRAGTRMRTEDMLPILREARSGRTMVTGGLGAATFDACIRFLKETPGSACRQLREALPKRAADAARGQKTLLAVPALRG